MNLFKRSRYTCRLGFGWVLGTLTILAARPSLVYAALAGEDCDDAGVIAPGLFFDSDTTGGRVHDYDLDNGGANGDCGTGQPTTPEYGLGPDAIYQLFSSTPCVVTINADPTGAAWDLALYVLRGSCNPGGFSNATCAGLSNAGADDVTERIVFTADPGVTYFIVVDGVNNSNGTFDISVECCPDADGDLVCDAIDICTGNDATGDTDADGICDGNDNCPAVANPDQADADGNGVGDACEAGGPGAPPTGNPVGQPSGQPAGQPTGETAGQPTGQPGAQPVGQCGCGSGADILLIVPLSILGLCRIRRRE